MAGLIILIVLMVVFILWDWYNIHIGNKKLRFLTKPFSVALIIVVFFTQVKSLEMPVWIFLVGLLLGLCGDILLMFPADKWFIAGLSSFLLGHIAYVIGFFLAGTASPLWAVLLLLVPVYGVLAFILVPILKVTEKEMKVSVFAYGLVIGAMLFSALTLILKPDWDTTAVVLAITGAGLFVTSDAMLAAWKFLDRNTEFWPMVTYHLAQMAIAAAVLVQFNK